MPAVKLAVARSECRCGCHEIGSRRAPCFDAKCPDGGGVCSHGEVIEQS